MSLTASGEVAVFIDDNQFGSGESQDKCGPEAVSLFWHSVKPGDRNPYLSVAVHAMAHDDYVEFCGLDTTSNHNGTSNKTLYDMLAKHHFVCKPGPTDVNWVKAWLAAGYPVIIGIVESSVKDLGLNGSNPYGWDTTGLTHVIVASGPGAAGELLVRDTANIGSGGVRPGPRRYDAHALQLVSATMVVPNWMAIPTSSTPPAPPAPVDYKKQAQAALASLTEALAHL